MFDSQNTGNGFYITRINSDDCIIFVNKEWEAFAQANKASHLTPEAVIQSNLWDFVCGDEIRHLYQQVIKNARETGLTYTFPFRCDSPDCRRFMELKIIPFLDGCVELSSIMVKAEYREPVKILDSNIERSDEFITMCSYCKKVFVSNSQWCDLEKASVLLDLFSIEKPPQITHGICPNCHDDFMKELGKLS